MTTNAKELTITQISTRLAERIQAELGQNVYLCYQCVKCSSGCPVGDFFDWQPHQVMRALQLGQEDIALGSETPWLCASCQTCTTRCPQGLDVARIMDFLTREALRQGYRPGVPQVDNFTTAFLREVRLWGRAYEPGLMAEMKLRNPGSLLEDIDLYTRMLRKRKVSLLPSPARPPRKIKPLPGASQAVGYYPGCSLHSTAVEFNHSALAVCKALNIPLVEPRGWVCCGSSAAHRADPQAALRLPLTNLTILEQSGIGQVAMPCAACFNRHQAALHEIRTQPDLKTSLSRELGYDYQDKVQVKTLTQVILENTGKEGLQSRLQKPLKGLRLVCYYGCLLTRPPEVTGASQPENPTDMDELMAALGAEVLDWSYKTVCCGAAHSLIRPDIVLKLSSRLITEAQKAGADLIAVACPLCHMNLDARQFQMKLDKPTPVLYFTQLMAIALGLPQKAAVLHKNLVDPLPLLQRKGLIS